MRNYEVISEKFDRITKCTMVVETTKIVAFEIFASPRKEFDAFGKKVSWQALCFLLRIQA